MLRYKNPNLDYSIMIPNDFTVDTSYLPYYLHLYNEEIDIKISKERSPYDYDEYFDPYIYKYLLNPKFRAANDITLYENRYETYANNPTKVVSMSTPPLKNAEKQLFHYYQALMTTENKEFYMFNIKTSDFSKYEKTIDTLLNSYKKERQLLTPTFNQNFKPNLPENLNEETLAYYQGLKNSTSIDWGIFVPFNNEMWSKVNDIEEKVDYDFKILLKYLWLGEPFPTQVFQDAYEDGKVVEFTLQTMWNISETDRPINDRNHSSVYDILNGKYDSLLKEYAKELKEFGHPVLFRLNNEMNSTWLVYSGIATMCDPDLFKDTWRYIYNLFEQEGVDNLIWVYNPNDRSYPPLNWNNQVSYYPGNDYVQMIGITGYNTGTYFKDVTGESWREFDQIYTEIHDQYYPLYKDFPWIIGEFSSSSVGGDKVEWIENMFQSIGKFKNIKAAVWWSYYDPDPLTKEPARKYWLDETPETLKAFGNGVK